MRRLLSAFAVVLLAASPALCQDAAARYAKLKADTTKKKAMAEGLKSLAAFFKYEVQIRNEGKSELYAKLDVEQQKVTDWVVGSKESLGVDLFTDLELLMEFMDEARVKADWGATKKVRAGSMIPSC